MSGRVWRDTFMGDPGIGLRREIQQTHVIRDSRVMLPTHDCTYCRVVARAP